ncbi:MAG: Glu/Leu/Phe/Val dehydrogenase dimerization region [Microgenomates group bacterium GW2011_GWC1_37_8]|uniref:Glu/Leu/Phe/Val dehydrogenase dimerization region n=1 Tax=Candidatus Woesebacteria bacterium GW2011_GWB1_38_8 TaxID=1618570 RepID=A0A0G0P7E5_9BACT|nr:MAG: Glu/Leu/Phe/Val dehydrogenase dimerization region [Microgenomates group bacterium GW2011_GWC1_37_8]KKQ85211.1 MAG: Glu/Leu/Phe/Val dehydrogenase dimerization region [Candidatus Woesebacteria bacterium GW2011_GWB1_38_8]
MVDDLSKIKKIKAFDNHKLVTYINDNHTGLQGFIAIHRGNSKTPAFGATRIWKYSSSLEALTDAIRLARTMSFKAALAGLKCGGAKAVIIEAGQIGNRKELLKSYAEKVNFFGGHFITGADVGISQNDVRVLRRFSPYFVGVKADPVRFTGLGLLYAIQACVKEVFASESLDGRSFAIQGAGKIGQELLRLIYPYAKTVYITDINNTALKEVKEEFPKVKILPPFEIHKVKVDVFSPCALGDTLNKKSINELQCAIIAGGANNQLEDDSIAEKIHKKGILYAPDYVINAGGLISVFDEYENGNNLIDRVMKKVRRIKRTLGEILKESKEKKVTPLHVANKKSEKIFNSL